MKTYQQKCICTASRVAQTVKNLPAMRKTWVRSLVWEDPLEKEWLSTPVFLPGEFHGQRSLAGPSTSGRKESGHDWATFTFTSKIAKKGIIYTSKKLAKYFSIERKRQNTNIILLMPWITPATRGKEVNDRAECFLYSSWIHWEQTTLPLNTTINCAAVTELYTLIKQHPIYNTMPTILLVDWLI